MQQNHSTVERVISLTESMAETGELSSCFNSLPDYPSDQYDIISSNCDSLSNLQNQ